MERASVSGPEGASAHRGWRRLALAVLLLGAICAMAAVIIALLTSGGSQEQATGTLFDAGPAAEFEVNQPVHFPDFWLVRRGEAEFLALYKRDPESGCTVPWRPQFEYRGWKGWFRDPCHGATYDLAGRCFTGPCPRGLDRFPVTVRDGHVFVDTSRKIQGPVLGPEYQP